VRALRRIASGATVDACDRTPAGDASVAKRLVDAGTFDTALAAITLHTNAYLSWPLTFGYFVIGISESFLRWLASPRLMRGQGKSWSQQ